MSNAKMHPDLTMACDGELYSPDEEEAMMDALYQDPGFQAYLAVRDVEALMYQMEHDLPL